MIPSPWVGVVLALGVYRIVRLIGWDDFPPVLRARQWVTGEERVESGSANTRMGLTNEQMEVSYRWRHRTLAHFIGCAYCIGFWIGLAVYLAWLGWPAVVLYGLAPFALNATVGIISRNLDP